MKYLKRVLSLALCLLMLVSSLPVAAFAATGETNLVYKLSTDIVETGEEFTVTIGNKAMQVSSIAFGLNYDRERLEVIKITQTPVLMYMGEIEGVGETQLYVTPTAVSSLEDAAKNGYVGVTFASTVERNYLEKETVLTVTFKVKEEAAGLADISFFETSDGTNGYKNDKFATESVTISSTDVCRHSASYQTTSYENEAFGKHTKTVICDSEKGGCDEILQTVSEDCSGGIATCKVLAVCEFCKKDYGVYADHAYGELIPAVEEVHANGVATPAKAAYYICSVCDNFFTEDKQLTEENDLFGETPTHDNNGKREESVSDTDCSQVVEVTFCSVCGLERSRTDVYDNDLRHIWKLHSVTWSADHSATAKITCQRTGCQVHEEVKGNISSTITTASTCSAKGEALYTAKFVLGNWEAEATKVVAIDVNPDAHDWNMTAASFIDNGDNTHTPVYTCKRDAAHTKNGEPVAHEYDATTHLCACGASNHAHDMYWFDDNGHWSVCSCGVSLSDSEAHVYDNDCDYGCNICGAARNAKDHVFVLDTTKGTNGYEWYDNYRPENGEVKCTAYGKCVECGTDWTVTMSGTPVESQAATCTSPAVFRVTVTHYGSEWAGSQTAEYEDPEGKLDPTNHANLGYKNIGDGTHMLFCYGCQKAQAAAEVHDKGTVRFAGNCRSPAEYTCSKCHLTYQGVVNMSVHAGDVINCMDNGNGTHSNYYTCCGTVTETALHSYDHGFQLYDDTRHAAFCICGVSRVEGHRADADGWCPCGAFQTHVEFNGGKFSTTPPEGYDEASWLAYVNLFGGIDGTRFTDWNTPNHNNYYNVTADWLATLNTRVLKEGHRIVAYAYDAAGDNPYESGTPINEPTTLYMAWAPNTYTLSFENTGDITCAADTFAYGANIRFLPTPAKAGHTFMGWYDESGEPFEVPAVMPAHDVKLTAQWQVNEYTVQFRNEDGTLLQSKQVEYGKVPSYDGNTPVKAATTQYTYTFAGWDNEIAAVTGDVTYTATYDATVNKYTVKFLNEDGTELQSGEVAYGDIPAYTGSTPVKAATAQYTYTFAGWDKALATVTGKATYTATYIETVNKYTVSFVDEDGTELQSKQFAYGEMPAYTGKTPVKAATAQYTYTFAGWTPEIEKVVGEATYKATYTARVNNYTVTWIVDGVETEETYAYGATPTFKGTTDKAADAQYTYTFAGWDKTVAEVTGDAVYTAKYDATVNEYTVTWIVDGVETEETYEYGATPSYKKSTDKAADAQYTYTFAGWDKTVTAVTGDAVYTAKYDATVNEYTVTWIVDGTEIPETYAYGTTPNFTGSTDKAADAQYTYTFAGWDKTVAEVTGDAVYTAKYDATVNKYTVTWIVDGVETEETYEYGATPTFKGTTDKAADAQYTYTFAGWTPAVVEVTGDATYIAKYDATVNKYTVKFVHEDGTVLQEEEIAYGELPVYAGETPFKAADESDTYTFAGWAPEIAIVTEDAEYTAIFRGTVNKYIVLFLNDDGELLQADNLAYGDTPAYTGETPVKAADAQYTYTFAGWDKTIEAVSGDATYTATYTATVNEYTVTWNVDGVKTEETYAYGETPEFNGSTDKAADAQYTYTFAGWDKTVAKVTGDVTYTATYTATVNEYTVTWIVDGVETEETYVYGAMPNYKGSTTKAADAQYTYTFAGWDKTIATVTGDATYTAKYNETVNKYIVKFVDEDGNVLQSSEVAYGETPAYTGKTPTKEATAQYSYTFAGWDAEIVAVTGNATYKATFTETVNEYTVKFLDEDGTVLQSGKVAYGAMPEAPADPAKAATAQYTYTFAGWDAEIVAVTGEATYKATYTATVNEYTVKFLDEDGIELKSAVLPYGAMPEAPADPTKAATAQYTYTFSGWDKAIVAVTGEATYKATYTATVNEYTVKFVDADDVQLQSNKVAYGETPAYTGKTPTKAADAQYTYTFKGWTPEIATVTGDVTYKATYSTTVNKYTVKFVDENGTELKRAVLDYGAMPEVPADPTKAATAQYTYTFAGWDKEIATVTGEVTYKATYTATVNEYTVKFLDENGTELKSSKVAYGAMPEAPADPAKAATIQYTYTFDGWDKAIVAVTGEATYKATYTATVNKYTIKFVDEDGTELMSNKVAYGAMPQAPADPTKAATVQHNYTFAGWDTEIAAVTGDATYKATYTEAVNKYTVKFLNEDGTVIKSSKVAYGAMPKVPADPSKAADGQYAYTFAGWDAEIVVVTGDATYKATYTASAKTYAITWIVEGKQTVTNVAYGELPVFTGTPEKAADENYTYTFKAWDKAIVAVTGDAAYTATFSRTGWNGKQYLIQDEVQKTGWTKIADSWYYLDPVTGDRAEGAQRVAYPTEPIDGNTYTPNQVTAAYVTAFADNAAGWFLFGDDGKFQSGTTGIGTYCGASRYVTKGYFSWHPGVVKSEGAYYYFKGDTNQGGNIMATGDVYVHANTSDRAFNIGGIYTFDADGKLCLYDGITNVGGKLRYYEAAQLMAGKGLTKVGGKYIYVRYNGELVVNASYWVDANDLQIAEGTYKFDADGFMIDPVSAAKNGIVEENGKLYYYDNGELAQNRGLLVLDDGSIIYVRSNGQLATGDYFITNVSNYAGTDYKSGDKLVFGADGKLTQAKNGIVDGYYYENNSIIFNKGVVQIDGKWYYVRSNGQIVTGCDYWTTNVGNTGVIAKMYTFAADGTFEPEFSGNEGKEGVVDGYYYVDGVPAYGAGVVKLEDGAYIYVRSNGQLATGLYWATNHNDLLEAKYYDWGTDGKLYL